MNEESNQIDDAIENFDESQKPILWICSLMSILSYQSESDIRAILERTTNVTEYRIASSKRFLLVCIKFDNYVVISFRGTSGIRGWLSNLDLRGVPFEGGYTHYGFTRAAWDFLEDIVMLEIIGWSENNKLIWCGHSRGGAVANVAATLMTSWFVKSFYIVTFGCPKFADEKYHTWVSENMRDTKNIAVINGSDIVPSLPPSNWEEWKILLQTLLVLPFLPLAKLFKK